MPILSGHGAEQRSMERNYQSPARFRHAAVVVLPPHSISPDPSDYLLNISTVLASVSPSPTLSLSHFLVPVSLLPPPRSARPLAYIVDRSYVCTIRVAVCTYAFPIYANYRVSPYLPDWNVNRRNLVDRSLRNMDFKLANKYPFYPSIDASTASEREEDVREDSVKDAPAAVAGLRSTGDSFAQVRAGFTFTGF